MEHSPLPIIDLAALDGAPETRRQMLATLGRAAREVGFFYLIGHGLSEQEQQETWRWRPASSPCHSRRSWRCRWCTPPTFAATTRWGRADPGAAGSARAVRHHERRGRPRCRQPAASLAAAHRPQPVADRLPEMKSHLLAWQERLSAITLTLLAPSPRCWSSRPGCLTRAFAGRPSAHEADPLPGQAAGAAVRGGCPQGSRLPDPGDAGSSLRLEVETADGWISAPPCRAPWWSTSASCWSSPPTATSRHPAPGAEPAARVSRLSCAFFMAARLDATVPLLSLSPALAALAQGPRVTRPTRSLSGGENVLKGGCAPTRMWRPATMASPRVRQCADKQRTDGKARSARTTTRLTLPYLID